MKPISGVPYVQLTIRESFKRHVFLAFEGLAELLSGDRDLLEKRPDGFGDTMHKRESMEMFNAYFVACYEELKGQGSSASFFDLEAYVALHYLLVLSEIVILMDQVEDVVDSDFYYYQEYVVLLHRILMEAFGLIGRRNCDDFIDVMPPFFVPCVKGD